MFELFQRFPTQNAEKVVETNRKRVPRPSKNSAAFQELLSSTFLAERGEQNAKFIWFEMLGITMLRGNSALYPVLESF